MICMCLDNVDGPRPNLRVFKVGEVYEFSTYNSKSDGLTDFVVKPTKDFRGLGYGFTSSEFKKFFSISAAIREEKLDKLLNS